MSGHATNLARDRGMGHDGEVAFCLLSIACGLHVQYAHQSVVDELTLHDVTPLADSTPYDVVLAWPNGSVVAHEVKWKAKGATRQGTYGLEDYRWQKLLAAVGVHFPVVHYTVFDGPGEKWRTADVAVLQAAIADEAPGVELVRRGETTWFGGQQAQASMRYWPTTYWSPLSRLWFRS